MDCAVSKWIDHVLNDKIPEDICAFCFNLYEDGNGRWSMELVGTDRFDIQDEDWACREAADFGTRQNSFTWTKEAEWTAIFEEICAALEQYLKVGSKSAILKRSLGVGAGFVDGNIKILYSK